MMRGISFAALVALSLSAFGEPVLPVSLDSIGHVSELHMHWRVKPHARGECSWGIVWNVADSANFDCAELHLLDARYVDAIGRESAVLRLYNVRGGVSDCCQEIAFSPSSSMHEGGGSLRLRLERGAGQAMLDAGFGIPDASVPVVINAESKVGRYVDCPADTLRDELRFSAKPGPCPAPFSSIGELRKYYVGRDDAAECEWVYYDRDTDPARTTLGGDYRLATVSDGSGGYLIVYVAGAVTRAEEWPPMRVKGRMRPTGFIGQYDLEWYDADGDTMGSDCSAMITDASMLTLRFPLYGATVRYRRAIKGE